MSDTEILYNQEEKLHYVIEALKLKNRDISKKLEMSSGFVSQIQNHYNGKLRKYHLHAICHAYNIPMEIFENKEINTKEMIDNLLIQKNEIFYKDYKLLKKLQGDWYLYSYPSNPKYSKVWITQTTIYQDFSVEDMHKNRGRLYIGKNQSVILKESHNSKNITSITFDNNKVTYGTFPFSRVSKSNILNRELFNFGFFSRNRISQEEAKDILGSIDRVQLHIDNDILERIGYSANIEG